MATLGQPLMGYPISEGDLYYYGLGCGDVISGESNNPGTGTCPVHGHQSVLYARSIITDSTSVARSC